MVVYTGTKDENLADFIIKYAETTLQVNDFKDKGITKVNGVIHISDPYNLLT